MVTPLPATRAKKTEKKTSVAFMQTAHWAAPRTRGKESTNLAIAVRVDFRDNCLDPRPLCNHGRAQVGLGSTELVVVHVVAERNDKMEELIQLDRPVPVPSTVCTTPISMLEPKKTRQR
jgi:hypothetical protein